MFPLISKKLIQNVYRIAGNSAISSIHVLYLQTLSLQSNPKPPIQHTPTVSYLTEKCGLPLDFAISASKKLHIGSTAKPDSVLQLLKDYSFTQTQITKLFSHKPSLILADPAKTLKPKFEFLEYTGLSKLDIAKVCSSNIVVLQRGLESQLIPFVGLLKRFIHTNADITSALCRRFCHFDFGLAELNIAVLRDHGVSESNIGKLLMLETRAIMQKNDRFLEIVSAVEKMIFDPDSRSFVLAIAVMGAMGKSCWDKKIEAYMSFGLSKDDVISAFALQPHCMLISEKKIRELINFFLNELGLRVSDITKYPNLMLCSLEKRIIPRCSFLQVLVSNGLIESNLNKVVANALIMSKDRFERSYVYEYKKVAPDTLKAYRGELGYSRLETLREILQSGSLLSENSQGIGN